MKKILLLSNQAKYTYRLRKELIFELLNQNYLVEIICPYGKELDEFQAKGVNLNHLSFESQGKNPFKELLFVARLIYLIFKIKPDIILGFTIKFNIYGNLAARLLRIPFIANITGLGDGFSKSKRLQKFLLFMYRISFRKISHIFFQNEDNKNFFASNDILNGSYSILPGSGINLEDFPWTPIAKNKTTNILFLSRVIKDKGIEEFLEMAKKISSSRQFVCFHVAGTLGEDYESELTSYENANVIRYHGEIEDVASLIQKMDVVVSPSYHEGMSNTLLEAAAIGRPIIASDIAGCREVVNEGVSGLIVPVKEIDPLIEAVETLLVLERKELERMGYLGRKHIETRFDRTIVVDTYLETIQQTIQTKNEYEEGKYERVSSRA